MGLIAKETKGTGAKPIEPGLYPARCVGVVDIGLQHNDFKGKDTNQVIIVFELPTERIEVDGVDKPRWQSGFYTSSLHEKAKLRKMLEAWRGKVFTADELRGFDLTQIIDKPCLLNIANKQKANGDIRSEISSVSPLMKGMVVAPLENEPLIFDMDAPDAVEKKAKLPQWMQDKVAESATWQEKMAGGFKPIEDGEIDDEDGVLPF